MKERPSSGKRVVLCDRKDCAFTGDMVSEEIRAALAAPQGTFYECEAEIIVLDRRKIMGRTCGRFTRKG